MKKKRLIVSGCISLVLIAALAVFEGSAKKADAQTGKEQEAAETSDEQNAEEEPAEKENGQIAGELKENGQIAEELKEDGKVAEGVRENGQNAEEPGEDQVVLTVSIGDGKGDLGYSPNMIGGGSGPGAFAVTDDGTIYIADNVNERVNVYKDGKCIDEIDIPDNLYTRSMVISDERIYLMEEGRKNIYVVDMNGNLVEKIVLPKGMKNYLMQKLYVQDDGTVCLYYERDGKIDVEDSKGVLWSYPVEELAKGKCIGAKGYVKNGVSYSISEKSLCFAPADDSQENDSSEKSVSIADPDSLTDMKILNVDRDHAVYVAVYETVNASIVAGEYTVRQYVDGSCERVAAIDLEPYYFRPAEVLLVSEAGELYQMICYENKVEVVKKAFVDKDLFQSDLKY